MTFKHYFSIQYIVSIGFQELNLNDSPTIMTILDSQRSHNSNDDGLVCVGYKHHWEVVNGRLGKTQLVYSVEGSKTHLLNAFDLFEDQEIQLLLCYNRK